ncbi:hypothetical protein BCR44DRAFT_1265097 [Catenaria anguillulae PL171]|uniref:Uncharacterized protein n=1 Tax=Catenaria anguillulae PL171 TaxID=765915 RepID=A0A1Y2HAH1_9FUNG|nr:hypothetical protein BCR44DRAFT_1265097 [Catenaria anguillulae PL171]
MVVEASANGDVEFLKIWKHRRGIWIVCTTVTMHSSWRPKTLNSKLCNGGSNGSGLPLKYDWVHVVHTALACDGWPFMVQWWMRQDGYTLHAAECAQVINECEELFMLERWDELGRILPFDLVKSTYHAVHHGIIDVLEWWMNKSEAADALLDGKNPALADVASVGCQINCLDWIRAQCQSRNVAFASSEQALDGLVWDSLHMDGSEPCRQFAVVQWWCSSGLDLKYTEAAFKNAIYSLSSEQIKWWIGMRLPLPMPQDVDQDFFDSYDDIAWATGGPRLVYDHWFRTQLGYSAD